MKTVLFYIYPGIKLLDLTGPLQVFADANRLSGEALYDIAVISSHGGTVTTDAPLTIASESTARWFNQPVDTLIVVGGEGWRRAITESSVVAEIALFAKHAQRVASVCTGAFLLAETGLLHGKLAVTHWSSCSEFAERYPSVRLDPEPIFVHDDNLWTSAGVTSGLDMALAMIESDVSRSLALKIAQQLVTYLVRPGTQAQFSRPLMAQCTATEGSFADLIRWVDTHLQEPLTVEKLAEHMHMSPRTLARRFQSELDETPARFVELRRLARAQTLLETTVMPIKQAAFEAGFGDEARLRRAFKRHLRVNPQTYRNRFSRNADFADGADY